MSPNGAPTTSRPGAAHTPAIRPTAPLQGPFEHLQRQVSRSLPRRRDDQRGDRAAAVRMRVRYQNGPSMSGADVTPAATGRRGSVESRRTRWERGGVRIHNGHSVRCRRSGDASIPADLRPLCGMRTIVVPTSRRSTSSWSASPRRRCSAVWSSAVGPAVLLGLVAAAIIGRWSRSWWPALLVVGLTIVGGVRAEHAWNGLTPDRLGPYDGWVRLVDDPQPYRTSTRLVVAIDGERFEVWCRGRAQQSVGWAPGAPATGRGERHRGGARRRSCAPGRLAARRRRVRRSTGRPTSTPAARWRARRIAVAVVDRARSIVDARTRRGAVPRPGDR